MPSSYTHTYSLSVGPIISTIQSARKTREVWGASYIFSELVKRLANQFDSEEDSELISPVLLDEHQERNGKNKPSISPPGAGIYPDIIIWKSKRDIANVSNEIKNIATSLAKKLNSSSEEEDKLDLTSLLRLPLFKLDTETKITDKKGKEIPFNYITSAGHLAAQEETWTPLVNQKSWWSQENQKAATTKSRHWVNELLGIALKGTKNSADTNIVGQRLRSLIEVSAIELAGNNYQAKTQAIAVPIFEKDPDPDNDNLFYQIQKSKDKERLHDTLKKTFKDHNWRMRHKYLAIIHGDGDKIGEEIIGAYGHVPEDAKKISKALAEYAAWSAQEVAAYGGQPIYMGGDDLFFFAPLVGVSSYQMKTFSIGEKKTEADSNSVIQKRYILENGKDENGNEVPKNTGLRITLLELLKHLSTGFSKSMGKLLSDLNSKATTTASTSFGVHIMHYKQPLDQAIKSAYELLVYSAKKNNERPAVAFQLEMHSNAPSAITTLGLDREVYKNTMILAAKAVDNTNQLDSYFSGMQHRISGYLSKHIWANQANYSVRPFFQRAVRKQEKQEPDGISEAFYTLLKKVLKQDKLKAPSGEDESAHEYRTRLAAELQFALKFTHLLQRKDIGHGRR